MPHDTRSPEEKQPRDRYADLPLPSEEEIRASEARFNRLYGPRVHGQHGAAANKRPRVMRGRHGMH